MLELLNVIFYYDLWAAITNDDIFYSILKYINPFLKVLD